MESPKSSRFQFTAYEDQWHLFQNQHPLVAEWGWNTEVAPTTNRLHYQGFIRTSRQMRMSALIKAFPGVHFEVARNWDALINYCKKEETRVDGTTPNHETFQSRSLSMSQALIEVARHRPRLDYSRAETPSEFRELYIREYEMAVSHLLRKDANLIGLYSQPQYERSYIKWRSDWIWYLEQEKTDRQTDTESVDAEILEYEIEDDRAIPACHFE